MAPAAAAQPANWPAGRLVTVQLPSPLANATGMVLQPATPVTARSVRPLPLKSPVTTFAPGDPAQAPNWPASRLVTVQLPSPLANATGMVLQPATPVTARSVRPLPLKSPVTTFAPGDAAQPANWPAGRLVTVQLPSPSPLAKATGMVLQPATPVTARSVRPLPLKSPVTTFAPGD